MRVRKTYILSLKKVLSGALLALCACLFSACELTKFVPRDEYLLNDVKVKVKDTKSVSPSELMKYVQQKQNTEILGFWKLQLGIYNTSNYDSTDAPGTTCIAVNFELADKQLSFYPMAKSLKREAITSF